MVGSQIYKLSGWVGVEDTDYHEGGETLMYVSIQLKFTRPNIVQPYIVRQIIHGPIIRRTVMTLSEL